jgi:pimeloyl-ACP methyl ester carboxylesterase
MTQDTAIQETLYVKSHNVRLRVHRITPLRADRRAAPLVFLHEGLGCIELWRDFPERLCESVGRIGVIYDRRGYGESSRLDGKWPPDYQETEAMVYLPAVLDHCGISSAVLIGHSDGGSIALIAGAALSDRISGIITEAAHIFIEEITLAGIQEAVAAFRETDLPKKLARYHGDNTEAAFFRWADTWLDPAFREWNIEHFLQRIVCPLLVIQGVEDEYATEAQVTGIASQVSGPVETLMVPGCRHIPHLQAGEAVLNRMARFVAALPASPPAV